MRMQSKCQNLLCKNKTKEFKLSKYIVKMKKQIECFLLNIILLKIAHVFHKINSIHPFIYVHEQKIYIEKWLV